jgi:DNA polymerase-3 subunit alpha
MAIGFYLSGHPLDDYMPALRRRDVKTLTEVLQLADINTRLFKMAGSVSAKQERKSAKGNRFAFVSLSDPTGLYEVTVFSDTLEAARDCLEPGQNVVLTVEATLEGETLKLLARAATPIDVVADAAGASDLRIHINQTDTAASLAGLLSKLTGKSRAQITLCMQGHEGREIDVSLPGTYPITPQIKGAIKAMQGVVMVEDV